MLGTELTITLASPGERASRVHVDYPSNCLLIVVGSIQRLFYQRALVAYDLVICWRLFRGGLDLTFSGFETLEVAESLFQF